MLSVQTICNNARQASYTLALCDSDTKNRALHAIADCIERESTSILQANALDLQAADALGTAMQDRLRLTEARIRAMAEGVRQVAQLPDPVGTTVTEFTRPNGLRIRKVRVPFGVIGVIYEARPNVTVDVAALCLKSGNCVVLRGGKEAIHSNRALAQIVCSGLEQAGLPSGCVGFIDDTTRTSSQELLQQSETVDVIIPRGGDGLKQFVTEHAKMPVIASAGGNCHLYVEKSADLDMAQSVVYNAKMSRPSVCNALEQLLVDRAIAAKFLPSMLERLHHDGCRIVGCAETCAIVPFATLAKEEDYATEHHDYELTVKVVDGPDEAIDRINRYNTRHSDGILTQNDEIAQLFTRKVDAACVYVNASTRFTDGFEFGFGAEIAISTQKLHARGPLGLEQLTSEKYVIVGNGQVRQ